MRQISSAMLIALALPASALAHPERESFFPDYSLGSVPQYRDSGPAKVVCKQDSRGRIEAHTSGETRARNLALLDDCAYSDIQAAVNAAETGDRILVLPGVYEERPSLETPADETDLCKNARAKNPLSDPLSYEEQFECPNVHNLIAIFGDDPDDDDRECDQRCKLQIEGTGDDPEDVYISGSRSALNVIRADRADGVYLANFKIEFSDFNNIYVLETNGFTFDRIISGYSREYGFLSFASHNGLYTDLEAYGSGDSGVYPGSGPDLGKDPATGNCQYGIEIRRVDSHDNTIGYSGTAGNSVWAHDNRFHHNATGMTTDSFAGGHPGMPQDCAKWEGNHIYSNNADLFNAERDHYCKLENNSYEKRNPKIVCPTFQVPVGTGILIAGGNDNLIRDNYIYDNWRDGSKLLWIPAPLRGEDDPAKAIDTSFRNRYQDNRMGVRPSGAADPNGNDFWWDEEGQGNCWKNNTGPGGDPATSNVPLNLLPECDSVDPRLTVFLPGNPAKSASQAPCAFWDPQTQTDPPGCDWFERPQEPAGDEADPSTPGGGGSGGGGGGPRPGTASPDPLDGASPGGSFPGAPLGSAADFSTPVATVGAPRVNGGSVSFQVSVMQASTIVATGTIGLPSGASAVARYTTVRRRTSGPSKVRLTLRLKRAARDRVRGALRRRGSLRGRINVTVQGTRSGRKVTHRRALRIRR